MKPPSSRSTGTNHPARRDACQHSEPSKIHIVLVYVLCYFGMYVTTPGVCGIAELGVYSFHQGGQSGAHPR